MPTPVQILVKDSATNRNRELETNDLAGGDVTIGAVTIADGGDATQGAKADAANTATNTTPISAMSVWKQISASVQAIASSIAGTLTVATHAVTQSGTWTVQPGNTANTTAWKVDGSAVTQPINGSLTNLASITTSIVPGTAATNLGKAEDAVHASGDVGIAMWVVRQDTVAALAADGDYIPPTVDSQGNLRVNPAQITTATATLANVSGSASSVTVLALNTSRVGAVIVNDSTAILYLKFGSTASATSFTYKMQADDTIEVPSGYTGILTGLWASATGAARVTELTS